MQMKLEDAIQHCEEVAERNENTCKAKVNLDLKKYRKCAEEHRQLAEWLKDYKRLLEQPPLEKVLEEIKAEIDKQYKWLMCTNHTLADIDIAFDAVKYSIDKHISGKEKE